MRWLTVLVLLACNEGDVDLSPCNEAIHVVRTTRRTDNDNLRSMIALSCVSPKATLEVVGTQVICRCSSDAGAEKAR